MHPTHRPPGDLTDPIAALHNADRWTIDQIEAGIAAAENWLNTIAHLLDDGTTIYRDDDGHDYDPIDGNHIRRHAANQRDRIHQLAADLAAAADHQHRHTSNPLHAGMVVAAALPDDNDHRWPYREVVAAFENAGMGPDRQGRYCCPAHDSDGYNVEISERPDGTPKITSYSCDCQLASMLRGVGLDPGGYNRDNWTPTRPAIPGASLPAVLSVLPQRTPPPPKPPIWEVAQPVDVYHYHDTDGTYLRSVIRYPAAPEHGHPKKTFTQRIFNTGGDGQPLINNANLQHADNHHVVAAWKIDDAVPTVPYRLPELIAAITAAVANGETPTVYWVEGEKDADRLWTEGHLATTSPQGARGFEKILTWGRHKTLTGADVIVWADHDTDDGKPVKPGDSYAANVARGLTADGVNVIGIAYSADGLKDASDHFDAGHRLDDIRIVASMLGPTPEQWAANVLDTSPADNQPTDTAAVNNPSGDTSDGNVIDLAARRRSGNRMEGDDRLVSDAIDDLYDIIVDQYAEARAIAVTDQSVAVPIIRETSISQNVAAAVYDGTSKVVTADRVNKVLAVKAGQARLAGDTRYVSPVQRESMRGNDVVNSAGLADRAILDLQGGGKVAEVSAAGWEIIDTPICWWRQSRPDAMPVEPVAAPDRDSVLAAIRNLTAAADPRIVVAYLAGVIIGIEVPILYATGPAGATKTSSARQILRVLRPYDDVTGPPKDEDTFINRAVRSSLLVLDNLSRISGDLSDALCRAVTGSTEPVRKLYTDGELVERRVQCGVILTAVDAGVLATDVLSRTMMLHIEPLAEGTRRGRSEIDRESEHLRPRIRGMVLDAAVEWFRSTATPRNMSRMADWETLLHRIDTAFGWNLLAVWRDAATDQVRQQFAETPLTATLLEFMATQPICHTDGPDYHEWSGGKGTDLLNALAQYLRDKGDAAAAVLTGDWWPQSSIAFGRRLSEIRGVGDKIGLTVISDREKNLTVRLRVPRDQVELLRFVRQHPAANGFHTWEADIESAYAALTEFADRSGDPAWPTYQPGLGTWLASLDGRKTPFDLLVKITYQDDKPVKVKITGPGETVDTPATPAAGGGDLEPF